jgi:CD2 antigen cytoplasmic tail-binding protein 2
MDDIDDWQPEEDDDMMGPTSSEHEQLEAKRQRRAQRNHQRLASEGKGLLNSDDGDDNEEEERHTKIDNRTSLAAEGIEIEPFHMNQERTDGTGYFDGDTYVFRKHAVDEEPDAWLESLSADNNNNNESDSNINQGAMQRIEQQRSDALQEEQDNLDEWTEEDLYSKMLPHLAGPPVNETVLQAVQRYGALMKTPRRNLEKASSPANNNNLVQHDKDTRQLAKDSFDDVTEAANALLLKGKIDIYQSRQTDIQDALRQIQRTKSSDVETAESTAIDKESNANTVQWEYKGSQDHQIHGPFSSQDMLNWIQAGYFVGPSAVQIRSVQPRSKSSQEELLSDLMDDDCSKAEDAFVRGEWQMSDKVDFRAMPPST